MQYFENDTTLAHDYVDFNYGFGKNTYKFRTDSGTFSHGHIDPESALLMSCMKDLSGSFLDLGCGCGCIGIIMAKEYNLQLTQVDINERALQLADYNRNSNNVPGISVLSDVYDGIPNEKYDTIALNPPIHAGKAVMNKMYSEAPDHLNKNGCMYIVIQKKHGAESTKKYLDSVFKHCDAVYKHSGIFVFKCYAD